MRWKSISFLLMSTAVLVLNLHAIIPHTHIEDHYEISLTSDETSSPLDDLRHIDLGENHLEDFNVSSAVKLVIACQLQKNASVNQRRSSMLAFFPLEETTIPPPLIDSNSLRAPPVFT